jgi:hypothetical protein
MVSRLRRTAAPLMLASALGCLSGQTPSPSPNATLRRVQYAFTVDAQGLAEQHFNGLTSSTQNSSGVGSAVLSEGGRGTMDVTVVSVAPDGALAVRISEAVEKEPRPRDAYSCTVYGNTTVICPPAPAPSDAEWVLLSYMGRQFVEAASWDHGRWQRTEKTAQFSLAEDFTLGDSTNPRHTVIHEKKNMQVHNGGYDSRTDDVIITYDRVMEIPSAIHDDVTTAGPSGSEHDAYDFRLIGDSFATPTPSSPR